MNAANTAEVKPNKELTKTIATVLVNLLPFWGNHIITFFKLGNEYSMGLTLILTQFVKYVELYLDDNQIMWILAAVVVAALVAKYGKFNASMFTWVELHHLELAGTQSSGGVEITFNNQLLQVNNYVIRCHKIHNLIEVSNVKEPRQMIGEVVNMQLLPDLLLTVTVVVKQSSPTRIVYSFSSYRRNLQQTIAGFVAAQSEWEKTHKPNEIVLSGFECEYYGYHYPDTIVSIIQYMVEQHQYKQLRYFVNARAAIVENNKSEMSGPKIATEGGATLTLSNQTGTKNSNDKLANNKPATIDFTLDNIAAFPIEPNITLDVFRNDREVIFKLMSADDDVNLYEYVKKLKLVCVKYTTKTRVTFRNSVVLNLSKATLDGGIERFSMPGLMLNYSLVKKYNLTKFRVIDVYQRDLDRFGCNSQLDPLNNVDISKRINYGVDDVVQYHIVGDLHITIEKQTVHHSQNSYNSSSAGSVITNCLFESDETSITDFVAECIAFYHADHAETKRHITRHFVYNGMTDKGEFKFSTNELCDYGVASTASTSAPTAHMNLVNEHANHMRACMDKLRDIAYYARNGLKRKMGFLFHGQPGTGKTAMVANMALYDRRHILEIPFSVLKTREEFVRLMNLAEIDGISVAKNQLLVLFDEIDIGLQHHKRDGSSTAADCSSDDAASTTQKFVFVNGEGGAEGSGVDCANSRIKLDTILSQLDGVTNYDGLIIVATTNNKTALDPALYRELRLTPIEFLPLRREDVRDIVERFYGNRAAIAADKVAAIPDRHWLPSKLVYLCDKMLATMSQDEFVDHLLALSAAATD